MGISSFEADMPAIEISYELFDIRFLINIFELTKAAVKKFHHEALGG